MILSLRMQNIALIEQLTLEFKEGLHVLTGETGAGKSIIVDAVNLVLGGRADRDLIRTGTEKAVVEAVFDAADSTEVQAFLSAQQIECEGELVTLYREISRSGRNLCRICGVVMPLSALRELSALLMDVHGQHEHQFLMDARFHLRFLDASGDEAHQALLQGVADAYQRFIAKHRQYAHLVKENEQKQYRMEQLQKSLEELGKARLKVGEEETLTREKERYRNAEKINVALQTAYEAVAAGEGESILSRLKQAVDGLRPISRIGDEFGSLAGRAEAAYYELEEIGYELHALLEKADFDPRRAQQVEDRLDLIRRMERKYGDTVEAVLASQERMQEEYDNFATMDKQVAAMAQEDKKLLQQYRSLARQLTESRTALATQFEERMMGQLCDLGMEKTVFKVSFAARPEGKQLMPQLYGDDSVQFMISPNPGEPLKPLSRIASGGELSRLMLAVKTLEAEKGGVGCMVFDEIDTGISGRMAQVVAEKMAAIASFRQVLCVTHLPQIAAMAAHQLLVEKQVEDGRTHTRVRMLTRDERTNEVARMLGGSSGVDDSAKSHADHMLNQAAAYRRRLESGKQGL